LKWRQAAAWAGVVTVAFAALIWLQAFLDPPLLLASWYKSLLSLWAVSMFSFGVMLVWLGYWKAEGRRRSRAGRGSRWVSLAEIHGSTLPRRAWVWRVVAATALVLAVYVAASSAPKTGQPVEFNGRYYLASDRFDKTEVSRERYVTAVAEKSRMFALGVMTIAGIPALFMTGPWSLQAHPSNLHSGRKRPRPSGRADPGRSGDSSGQGDPPRPDGPDRGGVW
jgi:hypothetical protein